MATCCLRNSASRSALAIWAFTVAVWMVFCCSCFWISYAASASAFLVSAFFCSSDFRIANSLFFWAISVCAMTRASLADLSASAWAIAISRSAWALAMAASFLIREVLSAPRSLMRPFSSVTFWMLQERISIPSLSMSLDALDITWSEKESRSVLISFKESVPMISRILPWRESWRSIVISMAFLFKKFLAASLMPSAVGEIRTLATASTLTLIKSLVGTDCSVLISTVICPK